LIRSSVVMCLSPHRLPCQWQFQKDNRQ
jgi:hypothetical protein